MWRMEIHEFGWAIFDNADEPAFLAKDPRQAERLTALLNGKSAEYAAGHGAGEAVGFKKGFDEGFVAGKKAGFDDGRKEENTRIYHTMWGPK